MDEWVDIVDPTGTPTGETVLKSDAHREGYLHPTVHIWCYSNDGRVLLQKRGVFKSTFPMLWDVSVAGHIAAGEAPIIAALREIKEEIGLEVAASQLKKIGLFHELHQHENGIIDSELHHVFLLLLSPENIELTPQPEEVEALEWWTLEHLRSQLETTQKKEVLVPHASSYYEFVIRAMSTG